MKILHAKNRPPYYDVFMSKQGWSDWSRVIYSKDKNSIKVDKGRRLRPLEHDKVLAYILRSMEDGKSTER